MRLIEKGFSAVKEASPFEKRRQAEAGALYSKAVGLLGEDTRFNTAPGYEKAYVDYGNVGTGSHHVSIWTFPGLFGEINNPTRVHITVQKRYRTEGGMPRDVVGEYAIDRLQNSRYRFYGKMPLPTVTQRKEHAWSREPRKPLLTLLEQIPSSRRVIAPGTSEE